MSAFRLQKNACLLVAGGLVLVLPACDTIPFPLPSPEIPPELQFVIDNEEMFITQDDDPLARVIPGTPMDDLGTLSGCWGSVVFLEDIGSPVDIDAPLIKLYDVRRFDSESGDMNSWAFQRDAFRLFPVLVISSRTYEVVDESRLRLIDTEARINDPLTGEMETTSVGVPSVMPALATLSGDGLLFRLGQDTMDDTPEDPADFWVYRKFECP